MSASLGRSPSYTWGSLLAGREVVARGSFWRVADGRSIRVWEDRWIPEPSSFCLITPSPPGDEHHLVHSLLSPHRLTWDTDRLRQLFLPIDAERISRIPISLATDRDCLRWFFHKSGAYTVRSAYHLLMSELVGPSSSSSSGGSQSLGPIGV